MASPQVDLFHRSFPGRSAGAEAAESERDYIRDKTLEGQETATVVRMLREHDEQTVAAALEPTA
ncbi:hypothetical protein [Streptomyces sp. NPDC020951]|uniref:hypothetical protein n=1 Tax=Streptomyces sp. NPDC020951 TaxID=3365104 RepID=UPI0037ADB49A